MNTLPSRGIQQVRRGKNSMDFKQMNKETEGMTVAEYGGYMGVCVCVFKLANQDNNQGNESEFPRVAVLA